MFPTSFNTDPQEPGQRAAISADRGGELAFQFIRTFKMLSALRDRRPRVADGLDPASQPLLYTLAKLGDARVSDLAASLHADVSTVSRSVSTLTEAGLVEKTVSEKDRRAQHVALTDSGRAAVTALCEQRAEAFAEILSDWSPAEVDAFQVYLDRFAGDVETQLNLVRHVHAHRTNNES